MRLNITGINPGWFTFHHLKGNYLSFVFEFQASSPAAGIRKKILIFLLFLPFRYFFFVFQFKIFIYFRRL